MPLFVTEFTSSTKWRSQPRIRIHWIDINSAECKCSHSSVEQIEVSQQDDTCPVQRINLLL